MAIPKVLLQLDADKQPSAFDAIVAADSGVDQLLRHGDVRAEEVRALVHGAMFTRGGKDLRHTAIFVGGSDVASGEAVLKAVTESFFGPVRVSVMLDSNGANTTAAAAVITAARYLDVSQSVALVLGATGPVGQRVARLLAREKCTVKIGSRSMEKAKSVCWEIENRVPGAKLSAVKTETRDDLVTAMENVNMVISAGAAGVQLLPEPVWKTGALLQLLIDLNAVPPTGIEGVDPLDRGAEQEGIVCFGAVGVGETKMKIHKAAIRQLFQANDQILNAEQILEIGQGISS